MNKNQVKDPANQAKGETRNDSGKATGNKDAAYNGKTRKHEDKSGAVLRDINGEARKAGKSKKR